MRSRSEETKLNLLRAATAEFAEHGAAGARTGRIAASAGVNEALLHRYFGSKQNLFDQVFDLLVAETVDAVPITDDLGDYAGRLFDYYRENPSVVRLSVWHALENPGRRSPAAAAEAYRRKVERIAGAQREGTVDDALPATELLGLVIHLSLSGAGLLAGAEPAIDVDSRRNSVVTAVRRLVDRR